MMPVSRLAMVNYLLATAQRLRAQEDRLIERAEKTLTRSSVTPEDIRALLDEMGKQAHNNTNTLGMFAAYLAGGDLDVPDPEPEQGIRARLREALRVLRGGG